MSGFLRRPANIARNARAVSECVLCAQKQTSAALRPRVVSRLTASTSRSYATVNSGGPEPPKSDKDKKNEAQKSEAELAKGKEANDQNDTKDSGNVNIQLNSPGGKNEGETGPKISDEDMAQLEAMVNHMKKHSISKSQTQVMDDLVAMVKKRGIPPELREIMNIFAHGPKKLDLTTATKIWRMSSKLAKMAAEDMVEDEAKNGQTNAKGESDPEAKFNQSQEKDGKKRAGQDSKGGSSFNIGEIKLDLGTTLISIFLTWYFYKSLFPGESRRDITWQEFRTTFFDKGLVEKLTVINQSKVRVELRREAVQQMYPESPAANPNFYYYFTIGSVEAFERRLDEAHQELRIPSPDRIPVSYEEEVPWAAAIFNLAPTLLFIGALFWLSRRAAGGAGGNSSIFGIGKSRAKKFNHETDIKIKFSDVAGMDEAKVEIMEFVSFLKDPARFQKLGAKIPRGAILSGPPGTGKTLLAKATAGESGVPFFSVSGSEFVEMFVGVGASRVRDLFANARKSTPCIIFIDEIDAIGKSRAKQNFGGGNDEREATLNQILTEMDGFNTSEQVVVLAGTNRPDVLDRALLRPGRFDRHISIDRPTMDGRKQIFEVHLRKIVTSVDMEYLTGRLSALTPGFSGADIANCVNEAALIGMSISQHPT